jgi:hypothetical protein
MISDWTNIITSLIDKVNIITNQALGVGRVITGGAVGHGRGAPTPVLCFPSWLVRWKEKQQPLDLSEGPWFERVFPLRWLDQGGWINYEWSGLGPGEGVLGTIDPGSGGSPCSPVQ